MLKKVRLKDDTKVQFCELCVKLFNNKQHCDYCCQVYQDNDKDAEMDGKKWIQCDDCEKWNHTDCEV